MLGRLRNHVRQNLVAYLALFVALGGTAYAANTVGSADVIDDSLQSQDIHNGTLTAADLGLITAAQVSATQSTSSVSFTDLATVGPSVTVDVPTRGLVAVLVNVIANPGTGAAQVALTETGTSCSTQTQVISKNSAATGVSASVPGSNQGITNEGSPRVSGWLVFPPCSSHVTYKLQYRSTGGTASFSNRQLSVMVIR